MMSIVQFLLIEQMTNVDNFFSVHSQVMISVLTTDVETLQ